MTNFGDWKQRVYDPIYNDFQQRKDTKLEIETTKSLESLRRRNKISERNEVFESFRFSDVLKSPLGIIFRDIFAEYIEIPCFSCGKATGKTKNHTYPLSNLMSRFLSKDSHIVGFHSGTEKEVVVVNDQQWAFPKGSFKKQGEKKISIFHGFCSRCDHRIFKNADSKSLIEGDQRSVLEQLYRVLCSTYYMTLNHTVIQQYLDKKEKELGWRVANYSTFSMGRNPATDENLDMDKISPHFFEFSYQVYNLMQDFERVLPTSFNDCRIIRQVINVKEPSVIGSFFLLDWQKRNIKINGIIRPVDVMGALGIVYPISKTKTVCYIVGLPLGAPPLNDDLFSPYRDIMKEKGLKIALSKILLENQMSVKNLVLSPIVFDSLSEKQKEMLCKAPYVRGNDNAPEVNLFF